MAGCEYLWGIGAAIPGSWRGTAFWGCRDLVFRAGAGQNAVFVPAGGGGAALGPGRENLGGGPEKKRAGFR